MKSTTAFICAAPVTHNHYTAGRSCVLRTQTTQVCARTRRAHIVRCSDSRGVAERRAILLVDHGSKRAEANEVLKELRDMVSSRVSEEIVHFAHMELAAPTIHDAFTRCIADGATHVVIVPFFLSPGRHVTTDIPSLSASAAESFPGITYEVRAHLGLHPLLVDVVLERAR